MDNAMVDQAVTTAQGAAPSDGAGKQRGSSSELRAEMRVASARVGRVRPMLYLALAAGFMILLLEVTSSAPGSGARFDPGAVLAYHGALAGVIILTLLFVDRWPLPATLVPAVLHSFSFVAVLSTGLAASSPEAGVRALFWSVYFWVIVYYAARLSRLAKAHPEFYLSKWMRTEDGSDVSGHRARALEANLAYKRKERRVLAAAGVVLGALLLVGFSRIAA